jgi:hypothetical protein
MKLIGLTLSFFRQKTQQKCVSEITGITFD